VTYYLYAVVPRNVLFAQRRVARLNLTRHAAATAICSRGSRDGLGRVGVGTGGVWVDTQQQRAAESSVQQQSVFGLGSVTCVHVP
jgi:hypothetical protein